MIKVVESAGLHSVKGARQLVNKFRDALWIKAHDGEMFISHRNDAIWIRLIIKIGDDRLMVESGFDCQRLRQSNDLARYCALLVDATYKEYVRHVTAK